MVIIHPPIPIPISTAMRTRSSRSILSNLRFPSGLRIGIRGYATTTTTTTHPVTGPKNNHHSTAAAAPPPPPAPRPFKPLPAHERIARYPDNALEDSATSTEKNGKGGGGGGRAKEIFSRLWRYASTTTTTTSKSTTTAQPEPIYPSSPDPQRGIEAARRVVREGVLDARYSRAAKNFTLVMCALPIAIYTSYELFQRRFRGKLQRGRVVEREGEGDGGGK